MVYYSAKKQPANNCYYNMGKHPCYKQKDPLPKRFSLVLDCKQPPVKHDPANSHLDIRLILNAGVKEVIKRV